MLRIHLRFVGRVLGICLALLAVPLPSHLWAHDIPNEIAVTGFVKPAAGRTDVLLRLPLTLVADVDLPKTGPGYLDWPRLPPFLRLAGVAAARAIALHDGERALTATAITARIALPSDRAFVDHDSALAAIQGLALPVSELVYHNQGFLDVHLAYPAAADPILRVNLAPGLGDRLHLGVRVIGADGSVLAYELRGGQTEVRLDPRWHQAAGMFMTQGIRHILTGIDHLLFLLVLILPFQRRLGAMIGVVTAFTVGHSVTLIVAALGLVSAGPWFSPVVETLIAASIFYMAIENALWARLERRWMVATGMGLLHGFGFANAVGETLQFAGAHLALSIFSFNLGIEIGQIAVLCLAVPVLNLMFRNDAFHRFGILLISILAGHEAWHWMTERAGQVKTADLRMIDWASAQMTLAVMAAIGFSLALVWPLATRLLRRLRGLA